MVDFAALTGDFRLEEVKKEMLNKVIRDADLDGDGLQHHLKENGHGQILSQLFSDDTIARLGMHPDQMPKDKIDKLLADLMTRLKR